MVLKITYSTVGFLLVKDRIYYRLKIKGWTTDPAERTILAFSFVPNIELRLPAAMDNQSLIHIVGLVRDTLNSQTEFNVSSVLVRPDSETILDLVERLQNSTADLISNPLVKILADGNQNTISQVMISLSQEFNQINDRIIDVAITSERRFNADFLFRFVLQMG